VLSLQSEGHGGPGKGPNTNPNLRTWDGAVPSGAMTGNHKQHHRCTSTDTAGLPNAVPLAGSGTAQSLATSGSRHHWALCGRLQVALHGPCSGSPTR